MKRRMRVKKIMTMLPQPALQQPLLKRLLLLPQLRSPKSQAVTRIQTRCTAWQAVKNGRSPLISMLQTLQMLSVAAMRMERMNCKLYELQAVQYCMLTLIDTAPKGISKSVSYALAPPLRADTASPPLSPRPHLRLPAVTVKPSTVTRMQVSSKSCNLVTMNAINIY